MVGVCLCVYVHMHAGDQRHQKGASDLLELHDAVSCPHVGVGN